MEWIFILSRDLQSSFESLEIVEDTRVGNKILPIDVKDPDLTGMALSVNCTPSLQVNINFI